MESKNGKETLPVVSIICTAYNQEKYIGQCLDGFIMQKTEFPFEVLVNDDASPDHTADVIREYEKKYPEIIKATYQTENQLSKGRSISGKILFPQAKGKYIAFCEGDDYWTDPLKLQKQFEIMETNPDCHLCCHTADWVSKERASLGRTCPTEPMKTGKYDSYDFIKSAAFNFFHINSIFLRYEDMKRYVEDPPEFYIIWKKRFGDLPLILYMANLGNVYYFSESMSCYRPWSVPTSCSLRKSDKASGSKIRIEGMRAFDSYTNYKYHEICQTYERIVSITLAAHEHQYRYCVSKENRPFLKRAITSKRWRLKIYLGAVCPPLIQKYEIMKASKIKDEHKK